MIGAEKLKTGSRTATLFNSPPVRAAAAPAQVIETTYPALPPDDERSAIKQAIVRWLQEK